MPIERALNSAPERDRAPSRTIFGLSVVELTFAYGTERLLCPAGGARETARRRPCRTVVIPSLGPLSTPIGELYRYGGPAGGLDAMELRELEDWVIEPRFLQVPGVADVTPFGGLIKQLPGRYGSAGAEQVQPVHRADRAGGERQQQNAGGALLDNKQQSMVIRGVGLDPGYRRHREHRGGREQRRAGVRPRYREGRDRRGAADGHLRRC